MDNLRDGKQVKQAKTRLHHLEPNKVNGYGPRAQICPCGDWHIGASTCDEQAIKKQLDLCLKKHIYVIGMGDHLECATRNSVGDGVYKQYGNPDEQMERVIEFFRPVVKAGLLLGIHRGNHCQRLSKDVGIDVMKWFCKELSVPYFGHAQNHIFYLGKQSYTCHSTHGSSGSRLPYMKIRAAMDLMKLTDAEVILYGHTHGLDHHIPLFEVFNRHLKKSQSYERHVVLTGSFLRYRGSYAEEKNLLPSRIGSPVISLYASQHEIRVSI